jgi:hypothetical protein
MNWGSSDDMKKPFTLLAVLIFAIVALVHLLRFVFGWEVTLAGAAVPLWASALGIVIGAGLAVMLWRESRK